MQKHIYVLEDNEDIRDIIHAIFEGESYRITSFADVKSFQKSLEEDTPELFLLDVMLPDGNGMDVCANLKQVAHTMHIPIVMMSANFALGSKSEPCEADDFIHKPFDIDDLKTRVDHQLFHA